MRSIPGYIDQTEVRNTYTSVGQYKPRIALIQKLQLLYLLIHNIDK
jgi:hypothetical protein